MSLVEVELVRCQVNNHLKQLVGEVEDFSHPEIRQGVESMVFRSGTVKVGEHRFANILSGVLRANNPDDKRPAPALWETYCQAETGLNDLIKTAKRAQLLRFLDQKVPRIQLVAGLEGVFPGITGFSPEEMRTFYDQFKQNVFNYRAEKSPLKA